VGRRESAAGGRNCSRGFRAVWRRELTSSAGDALEGAGAAGGRWGALPRFLGEEAATAAAQEPGVGVGRAEEEGGGVEEDRRVRALRLEEEGEGDEGFCLLRMGER
jgi:hypothetical protein